MKSTGIVRKVDELGRIVLPIELRRTLNIEEKDALEIYVDDNAIMLKKYEPACIFCGSADGITDFKGKNICEHCLKELSKENFKKQKAPCSFLSTELFCYSSSSHSSYSWVPSKARRIKSAFSVGFV